MEVRTLSILRKIALTLLIIGGINWGLIGLFQYDLVASLFGGQDALLSRIIYTLVGLSALYAIMMLFEPVDTLERATQPGKVNYTTEFAEENEPYKDDQ